MTEKAWEAVAAFVDAHVESSELTVADVASVAGYSPFHFNRIFAARMGVPVLEYVRVRRLQHAASALAQGDAVLATALRYGFASHEGFTRAFKRQYGVTPQHFRDVCAGPCPVPSWHTRHGVPKGESIMQPKNITLPTRRLIGYRIQTTPGSADILALWNAVMGDTRLERLEGKAGPDATQYGLCIHPEDMPEGRMDYMIAVACGEKAAPDDDMELFLLEAATYMAFPVTIEEEDGKGLDIKRCWTTIYTQWFPTSGMRCDPFRPDFEAYHPDGSVEIYVPLTTKA